jgi:hypothetical protein
VNSVSQQLIVATFVKVIRNLLADYDVAEASIQFPGGWSAKLDDGFITIYYKGEDARYPYLVYRAPVQWSFGE